MTWQSITEVKNIYQRLRALEPKGKLRTTWFCFDELAEYGCCGKYLTTVLYDNKSRESPGYQRSVHIPDSSLQTDRGLYWIDFWTRQIYIYIYTNSSVGSGIARYNWDHHDSAWTLIGIKRKLTKPVKPSCWRQVWSQSVGPMRCFSWPAQKNLPKIVTT